jgi:hypothetical protein
LSEDTLVQGQDVHLRNWSYPPPLAIRPPFDSRALSSKVP